MEYCKNHPNRKAVNVKYKLCDECNYIRLHQGRSKFDDAKKRHIELQEKKKNRSDVIRTIQKPKKKRSKRQLSRTQLLQKEIKDAYRIACEMIDGTREHICAGCGTHEALSHSHIISQKDCKNIGKPELIYDEKNITFHCLDRSNVFGCHRKWESKSKKIMSTLLDFESNLAYIKSQSIELYNKIVNN